MKRELGIARCGLACCLCSENVLCKGCRRDGFLELSWCKDAEWCEVRRCGIDKGIAGCYECEPAACRKGLTDPGNLQSREDRQQFAAVFDWNRIAAEVARILEANGIV